MKVLHGSIVGLVIVGALNWGLVAIGQYMGRDLNVVHLLLGSWPAVETLVYLVVGVAAVLFLLEHKGSCRECNSSEIQ